MATPETAGLFSMKSVTIESQLCYIFVVMPSVETIYRETIRPLPVDDQRRLAEMILEHATDETQNPVRRRSVLEIIESARSSTPGRTAAEIDEYIRTERESWDD